MKKLVSSILSRAKYEFVLRILGVICSAILIIVLARILSPDEYGTLFLVISILTFALTFGRLGIPKSGARYITLYQEENTSQIQHIFRITLGLCIVASTIVAIVLGVSSRQVARVLDQPELAPLLLVGTLFVVSGVLFKNSRYLLQGFQDIKASATVHGSLYLFRLIFVLAFVLLGFGVLGALIGYIIAFSIPSIIGTIYMYLKHIRGKPSGVIESGLQRRIIEYALPVTLTSSSKILDKEVDTILVGFFVGPLGVAYYTVSKQVVSFVEVPASSLGFTLSPMYQSEKSKGNAERAARLYEESFEYGMLLYIPLSAVLLVTADPLIKVIFGNEYSSAVEVLQILALYGVILATLKLTGNSLDYLGKAQMRAIAKGSTAMFNFLLNLLLIPTIGVIGAAIATVFTSGIYAFINVAVIVSELDIRLDQLIKSIVIASAIAVVVAIPVYFLSILGITMLRLILSALLATTIWLIIIYFLGYLDPDQRMTNESLN